MASRSRKPSRSRNGDSFTPPRSPLRVMNVIEELAKDPMGSPLVRLCERLDLPKTSLLSLLRALEESNYVVNQKGLYRLGEAALRLSSLIATSLPFPHSVHDRLAELMARSNETAMLAALSEDREAAVYIDKAECQRAIRYSGFIGARRPLHCSGIGKALLAFQDDSFVERYLRSHKLERYTPQTITDSDALRREVEKIRKEGVALAIEEMAEGIGSFAAPVFDGFGVVNAAVSLAAPADRARALRKEYSREVKAAARDMSLLLGWKPAQA